MIIINSKDYKQITINVLLIYGISYLLKETWQNLELWFDGQIMPSNSDTIIGLIIIFVIWSKIKKWIEIK